MFSVNRALGQLKLNEDERERIVVEAMSAFWRLGAERATYEDVVAATGASRKALYAAWPDKNRLIGAALLHYRQRVLESLMQPLDAGGREGLSAFWRQLREAMREKDWRGCLLMRTAGGALRDQRFVRKIFREYVETLHRRLAAAISESRAAGTIAGEVIPETAAWQAVGLLNLMSARGAQTGYDRTIDAMLRAAERACGLTVSTNQSGRRRRKPRS